MRLQRHWVKLPKPKDIPLIRQFETTDTDAVIDVWYRASKLATPFLSDAFLAQESDNIRHVYLPNTETWVLEIAGHVTGFLSLVHHSPGDAEVGAVFLDPAFHGKGYGRALMDKAVSLYRPLRLDVFEENAIGRAFYRRYGYRCVGTYVHEQTGRTMIRLVLD
jgi:putative acetyltransferase